MEANFGEKWEKKSNFCRHWSSKIAQSVKTRISRFLAPFVWRHFRAHNVQLKIFTESAHPFGKEFIVPFVLCSEALLIAESFTSQTVFINFHKKLFFSPFNEKLSVVFQQNPLYVSDANEENQADQKTFRLKGICETKKGFVIKRKIWLRDTTTTHHHINFVYFP